MEFWLPYGRTEVPIAVPDENLLGYLSPVKTPSSQNQADVARIVSEHSVRDEPLIEAAKRAKRTVIAFNPRSAASATISNLLATHLLQGGASDVLLLETARDPTQPSPSQLVPELVTSGLAPLHRHDRKTSAVAEVGEQDEQGELLINELFASAEIRCAVATVSVSPFWGYSGGPSFLLCGLASESTVRTRLSPTLRSPRLPGVLSGNPTYEALLTASEKIRVDFAVHVVEAPDGTIAGVFAGGFTETFTNASALAEKMFRPPIERKADIAISSPGGAPWDRTLFDAAPGAIMTATACKDHAIMILVAECAEGLGDFSTHKPTPHDAKSRITYSRRSFSLERLLSYSFQRLCADHRVYLVSTLPEHHAASCGLLAARSVGNALQRAIRHAGRDAKIALLSHGSLTAPIIA